MQIKAIEAWEILDSRGRPTVAAACTLEEGTRAIAHAPSGASTGQHEAHELRDGDPNRYRGKGVLQAVAHVNQTIAPALLGSDARHQAQIDQLMIGLDGTPQKAKLGANAILAVSCAVARAAAQAQRIPLWQWLANGRPATLPVPMVNILSGGLHAGGNIEFQDFLVIPSGIDTYAEQIEAIVDVHHHAKALLDSTGFLLTGVADEGGWGPRFPSNEAAVQILTQAIEASRRPCTIALDVASTHFHRPPDTYELANEKRTLSTAQMIGLIEDWSKKYPVQSVEDPLAEDDWTGWQQLTRRLGARLQLIGDDFFTTNLDRLEKGIQQGCANAVLVKMNQIGTLTETFAVIDRARQAGYRAVISARSGETEDAFLADLATASGAGQIKVGSITRSERLAKYNRLFEIEKELATA